MPRITKKYLIEWLNKKFIEFEIKDYEVYDVEQTRFRSSEYESGAVRLYIRFRNKTLPSNSLLHHSVFYCFYSIGYLDQAIKDGYELYLSLPSDKYYSLTSLELEIRKNNIK